LSLDLSAEQINMIKVYDADNRTQLISDIKMCLPYVDETDVLALMRSVVAKLERMTEAEYTVITQPAFCDYSRQEVLSIV
jgi:hypothetical protein